MTTTEEIRPCDRACETAARLAERYGRPFRVFMLAADEPALRHFVVAETVEEARAEAMPFDVLWITTEYPEIERGDLY